MMNTRRRAHPDRRISIEWRGGQDSSDGRGFSVLVGPLSRRPLLLGGRIVVLDQFPIADLAAPPLHLPAVHEHVSHRASVEVFEVSSGPSGGGRPQSAGPPEEPLRPFEDEQDLRAVRPKPREAHRAVHIALRFDGMPHDARVRYLLDDRRVARLAGPQQLRRPTPTPRPMRGLFGRLDLSTTLESEPPGVV